MQLLALSLLLSSSLSTVLAIKVVEGGTCSQSNNHLNDATKQFTSDCSASTFCSSSGTCVKRGCRRDEYPYGYPPYSNDLPKRCEKEEFCPDEEDACQPLLAVDSLCQLNRDDQCAPPPNFQELANHRNFNGSLCLNYRCTWANVTVGNDCIVENTPYIGYEVNTGDQFVNVVSRGNCVLGLYCDAVSLKCLKTLSIGESCKADKECESDNCLASGVCGVRADAPKHFAIYVYVIVGLCLFLAIFLTLGALFALHKRNRTEEREKRAQYWREQEQFRQNIMQMREQAQVSLLSLPWKDTPTSPRDYPPSENSQTAILHATNQPSGLRHDLSASDAHDDDDRDASLEDALVMKNSQQSSAAKKAKKRA